MQEFNFDTDKTKPFIAEAPSLVPADETGDYASELYKKGWMLVVKKDANAGIIPVWTRKEKITPDTMRVLALSVEFDNYVLTFVDSGDTLRDSFKIKTQGEEAIRTVAKYMGLSVNETEGLWMRLDLMYCGVPVSYRPVLIDGDDASEVTFGIKQEFLREHKDYKNRTYEEEWIAFNRVDVCPPSTDVKINKYFDADRNKILPEYPGLSPARREQIMKMDLSPEGIQKYYEENGIGTLRKKGKTPVVTTATREVKKIEDKREEGFLDHLKEHKLIEVETIPARKGQISFDDIFQTMNLDANGLEG